MATGTLGGTDDLATTTTVGFDGRVTTGTPAGTEDFGIITGDFGKLEAGGNVRTIVFEATLTVYGGLGGGGVTGFGGGEYTTVGGAGAGAGDGDLTP